MTTNTTQLFTKKQVKDYAIVDYSRFKKQTEVRMLALAAAAISKWVEHAQATFSASTANRYIRALYWDPSNPDHIRLGLQPGTLGDILEHGQNEHDLRSIFMLNAKVSKEGLPYRVIPMRDKNRVETSEKSATPFLASVDSMRSVVQKREPQIAEYIIRSEMSQFDRASVSVRSTKARGNFLPSGNTQFRTITGFRDLSKPADTWKHPGIRAALIGNQISSWMDLNRESFTSDMFYGDPGITE